MKVDDRKFWKIFSSTLSPGSSISKNIEEKKFNVTQPDFDQIVSQIIGF
jgi:hypothetical protein